jgi:hypothetical protein
MESFARLLTSLQPGDIVIHRNYRQPLASFVNRFVCAPKTQTEIGGVMPLSRDQKNRKKFLRVRAAAASGGSMK